MPTTTNLVDAIDGLIRSRQLYRDAPAGSEGSEAATRVRKAKKALAIELEVWRYAAQASPELEELAELQGRAGELATLLQGALFLLSDFLDDEVGRVRPLEPPDAADRTAYRSLVARCDALGVLRLPDRESAFAALLQDGKGEGARARWPPAGRKPVRWIPVSKTVIDDPCRITTRATQPPQSGSVLAEKLGVAEPGADPKDIVAGAFRRIEAMAREEMHKIGDFIIERGRTNCCEHCGRPLALHPFTGEYPCDGSAPEGGEG